MRRIGTWEQKSGIEIDEIVFDGKRDAFVIYNSNKHITTIYADSPEQTEEMRGSLNAGEDVRDWEDGAGHCVGTLIDEEDE